MGPGDQPFTGSAALVLVLDRIGIVGVEAESHPELTVDLTLIDGVVPEQRLEPVDRRHHADAPLGLSAHEDAALEVTIERPVDELGDVLCSCRVCAHVTTVVLVAMRLEDVLGVPRTFIPLANARATRPTFRDRFA